MESVGVLPLVVGGWGQWVYSVVVEDGISGCTHIGSRRVGSVGVFTVVVEDGVSRCTHSGGGWGQWVNTQW